MKQIWKREHSQKSFAAEEDLRDDFSQILRMQKGEKYGDWCGKRDRTASKRRKRNREICCGAHCGVCHYSTCPVWNCICNAEAAAGCGDDGASDPWGLSCFAGGWYAGKRAGKRKFLQGLLVGILYFALLFLISGMGEREIQSDLASGGLACLLCAAGGMLGGMLA